MNYTLENVVSMANIAAQEQGKEFTYTLNQNNLLMMDSDIKELINYISDCESNYSTYSHS